MSQLNKISYSLSYLIDVQEICKKLDTDKIDELADNLKQLREKGGRLFLLGVGGSAANCSHAANDFRKLCNIETYVPTDNVSELTARTNDEGWETVFADWLKVSRICDKDALMVLSVGGGNAEKNISLNIVKALDLAKERGIKVFGIVGKKDGYTNQVGDVVVVVPQVSKEKITPYTEAFHSVIWHCLVSNPLLQVKQTKW